MADLQPLANWLQCECPTFWSLLKVKAQRKLPCGVVEYLEEGTADERETGKHHLKVADIHLCRLINVCGFDVLKRAYRQDLSGVHTASALAEMLCEITLSASLSKLSPNITPHPDTLKGTFCDVSFQLAGSIVYGEAKRYEDNWLSAHKAQCPSSRSIVKIPPGTNRGSIRPRFMDLRSKLQEVPRQFPDGTLNLLFLFHPSFTQTRSYIQQALFGEETFLMPSNELCPNEDGLFATEKWRVVSGCCYSKIEPEGNLVCPIVWENPRAFVSIPLSVRTALDGLKPAQ